MGTKSKKHKTSEANYVSYLNQSRSTFARRLSSNFQINLLQGISWVVDALNMKHAYIVLVAILCYTGSTNASTPEFKRGGVYLSGDVVLGTI